VLRKPLVWIAVAAVLAALAGAYYFLRSTPLQIATPSRGPAVEGVYATGTVEPVRYAQIGSKLASRIVEVRVKENEAVSAGDALAVTDKSEDASNVSQLGAKLALAETDAERARKLRRTGNVSVAALDQAVSALHAAEAALDAAKARLEDHFIRTPIAGVLLRSEKQLKVGDMVQPGELLFVVGDPSELQIDAEVDEEDIPKVEVGQAALLRADAFAGRVLQGKVSEITPFGDPVARTYRVHISLPPDTPLRAGMTSEINIVVRRQEDAMLVPATAISGGAVWTVVNGRAHRQKVEIGTIGNEKAEIRSGLAEDALVVVDPPANLEEGARLRVSKGT
jgi:RND family efflux transporter MFP subunit